MTSEPEKLLPVTQDDIDAATRWKGIWGSFADRLPAEDLAYALAKHRLSSPVSGTDMVMVPRADLQLLADLKQHIHEHEPDRVRWAGEWYYGPLATAYITTIEAVAEAATAMLSASPSTPIPVIAEAGEREPLLAREIAAQFYDKRDPLDQSYRDVAHNIRRGRLDDQDAVELVRFTLAHQALSTPATLDNTAVEGLGWRLERIIEDGGPLTLSDKAVLREAVATLTAKTEKAE